MALRTCENCGIKMPRGVARTPKEGKLLCEGCTNGREGRPLTGKREDMTESQWVKAEAPFAKIDGHIVRVAHQSGDGETIYHCFSGDTRYWTYDGLRTLEETVNTVQQVLVNYGSGGVWREAEIHSFGEQQLWKVTLKRNKRFKEIFATSDHRWLVRVRNDPSKTEARTVVTHDLKPEDRLAWLVPRSSIKQSNPSQFGIAHGICFGDGTRTSNGCVVRLWGEKDSQLLRYFSESLSYSEKTPNGVLGQRVVGLPNAWKSQPDLSESTAYLYGWLAGYFAADGTVDPNGQAVMYSAKRGDLELFQLIATRLGIATNDIIAKTRQGYGDEPSLLYHMSLISSTVPENFFLIAEHRVRHEDRIARGNSESIGWTIVSVEETDRVEEVYCAVVPEHENFVLDSWINCQNCPFCGSGQVVARSDGTTHCEFDNQTFIVQIQPQQHAMPQTINGVPFQIPGMPPPSTSEPKDNSITNPQDPNAAPAPTEPDHDSFGGDDLSEKVDTKDEDSLKDLNKGAMFITSNGMALPFADFEAHIALAHTANKEKTLEEVKRNRRER